MAPAGDQKHNSAAASDQIQHIRRIRGLVVSRLQLFIGSGVQQVQACFFGAWAIFSTPRMGLVPLLPSPPYSFPHGG